MANKIKSARPTYDREIFTVLRHIRGMSHSEAARKAGLSPSTIRNWRLGPTHGGTKFSQHWALARAMKAAGFRMKWEPINGKAEEKSDAERETRSNPAPAGRRGRRPVDPGAPALQ